MMEKDEHEREQRIRAAAQKSLACSKLPPRMQQHVDEKRRRIEENLDSTKSTLQDTLGFSFQPQRARSVPNFQKLQKAFVTQMEARKKAVAPTIPKPFNFHQPKPSAKLRTYMDDENQAINPTMRLKRTSYSVTKMSNMWDPNREEPATTKKHEAYVAKRREQMVTKKQNADLQVQEDLVRMYKQQRLQQRVKCSPAVMSSAASLKRTRQISVAMAKRMMQEKERQYEQIKAGIEYKVANRPLLVEQVSKAFIHNLNQIKELQRYV